jgi:two-component system response regulator PilR (NtrC family)
MATRGSVLVVDDETELREMLTDVLSEWGYEAVAAPTAPAALDLLRGRVFDLALVDLHMPEMSGLTFLRQVRQQDPALEVLMMTGAPSVASAVEALKLGAYDYLTKPLHLEELQHILGHLAERRYLRDEVVSLRSRLGEQLKVAELIGSSLRMAEVKALVSRVAGSDSPILVEGESGTGKELVAAAIHRLSPRAGGPFIPVNCGAVPADLMESEFFGHVRGAFSGAVADTLGLFRSAHGGTLFLDEVAELPAPLQVKLLRVLQDREVRPVGATRSFAVEVRVVAATNRDLDQAVRSGAFRQDLFYRLNVVRLTMPALRERPEDIPGLVAHFIRRFNQRFGRDVKGLAPEALAILASHEFPGNVRELENLIERAYALGVRDVIRAADLPPLGSGARPAPVPTGVATAPAPAAAASPPAEAGDGGALPTLADAERSLIVRALEVCGRDRNRAAQALGLSPRTLYRRLKEYGIR